MTVNVTERQLDLLAGPRQRGKRRPAPSEFSVHVTLADTLDRWLAPGWGWFHPANGEQRETPAGARLKRMGVKPGVADFILFAPPHGAMHVLELKRRGQRPTLAQAAFLNRVRSAGGVAAWADTYEEALSFFHDWGAVPHTVACIDGVIVVRREAVA